MKLAIHRTHCAVSPGRAHPAPWRGIARGRPPDQAEARGEAAAGGGAIIPGMAGGLGALGKGLVAIGLCLVAIGVLLMVADRFPALRLGRLPGDLAVERDRFRFYFPLGTSILISIVLSLVLWLLNRR